MSVFFRDRMAVFFALLSPLILFVIYVFFLGTLQTNSLKGSLTGASESDARGFDTAWLFAGVLTITTLSSALVSLGVFVDDRTSGRFKDFLVTPITRRQLTLGYLIAAFAVSLAMSLIVAGLSQVYLELSGAGVLTAGRALQTLGGVALLSLTFSAIMSCAVTFINSNSAFSAFNTIVGTAVGFLAGAYINAASLPKGVVNVINVLPFAQAAALLRKPFTAAAIHQLSHGRPEAAHKISDDYGVNLVITGHNINALTIIAILATLTLIFTALGTRRIGQKIG